MKRVIILIVSLLLNGFCFAQKTEKAHTEGGLFSGTDVKKVVKKVSKKKPAKKAVKKAVKKSAKKVEKKEKKKQAKKVVKKVSKKAGKEEKKRVSKEKVEKEEGGKEPEKKEGVKESEEKSKEKKAPEKKARIATGFVKDGEVYEFPNFGDLVFSKTSKKGIYEGKFKESKANIGPLGVKNFVLVSDNSKKQISCNVPVTFGPLSGKLSLEKIEKNKEYIFLVTLEKPIEIPVDKNRFTKIDKLTLSINSKGVTLYTLIKIGTQENLTLVFDNDPGKDTGKIDVSEISIGNLLASKDEKLVKCVIKSPKIVVSKIFSSLETNITFEEVADLSFILKDFTTSGLGKNLEKVDVTKLPLSISLNSKDGISIQCLFGEDFVITPNMFFIKNPKLSVGFRTVQSEKEENYEVKIIGDATLTGLQDIGLKEVKSFPVSINYKDGIFKNITGAFKEKIDYQGLVEFDGPAFEYEIARKSLKLASEVSLFGVQATTTLERVLEKDPTTKAEAYVVYIKGIPKIKEIKPFALTKIPGIEDIAILNPMFVSVRGAAPYMAIKGTLSMFGKSLDVEVAKKPTGLELIGDLGAKITLSTFIPFVKGTFLDSLALLNNKLVVYPTAGKGIGIQSDLSLDIPPFNLMKKLINVIPDRVRAFIKLPLRGETAITIGIPLDVKDLNFGSFMTMNRFELILFMSLPGASGPVGGGFGLKTAAVVRPTPADNLTFTLTLLFGPLNADGAGTMEGTWNKPLGIPGLVVENVAFETGFMYATPAAPYKVGITGTMKVGDIKATVASKTSANLTDCILLGKVNELSFKNIVSIAKVVGLNIPFPDLPLVNLRNVELKFAPKDGAIGGIQFYRGIAMKGTLGLLGVDSTIDMGIKMGPLMVPLGIYGSGSMSPIDLKILKITGKSDRGGPIIAVELSPKVQKFILSGLVSVLGISQETEILMGKDGISFVLGGKILNLFSAKVTGQSSGGFGKDMDFLVRAEAEKGGVLSLTKDDLVKAKSKFDDYANRSIQNFKDNISRLQNDINVRVKNLEDNVAPYKLLMSTVRTLQSAVNSARDKMSGLKSQLDAAERELRSFGYSDHSEDWKHFDIIVPDYYKYLTSSEEFLGATRPTEVWDKFDIAVPDFYKYVYMESPVELAELYASMTRYDEKYAWGFFRRVCRSVSNAASSVGNSVADAAKKAAEVAKQAAEKARQLAEMAAKKAAAAAKIAALRPLYEAARLALLAVEADLKVKEEALKSFDPMVVKMRIEQAALIVKLPIEQAALQAARLILEAAIRTYPGPVAWLTPIEIKKLSVELSLRSPLPKFVIQLRALGTFEHTMTISTKPDDIMGLIKNVVIDNIKSIVGKK